jgi:2-C-methyl-D-erythritol 4-phosphate cytidylyltransferase
MSNRSTAACRFFAVVPAAGSGARLGMSVPKQYLPIGAQRMIEWSVNALLSASWIERVVVVVSSGDLEAARLFGARKRVEVAAVGGETRSDSVYNGLQRLSDAAKDDWVLVHDAARPALTLERLQHLKRSLQHDPVGGLLAVPVVDTIKREAHDRVVADTVARERLWLAQTPQMFRYGLLNDALARNRNLTDEAAAIEAAGYSPKLVQGARDNFKVTTTEDFVLMQRLLAGQPVAIVPEDDR